MSVFDEWVHKGREFLHEFEKEAGLEVHKDDHKAYRIIKAILHTLRERLTPEESRDFISSLPMVLKALYCDGWDFTKAPDKTIRHKKDFLTRIMSDNSLKEDDIKSLEEAEKYFRAFIKIISKYEGGELVDIASQLPQDIREMFC